MISPLPEAKLTADSTADSSPRGLQVSNERARAASIHADTSANTAIYSQANLAAMLNRGRHMPISLKLATASSEVSCMISLLTHGREMSGPVQMAGLLRCSVTDH